MHSTHPEVRQIWERVLSCPASSCSIPSLWKCIFQECNFLKMYFSKVYFCKFIFYTSSKLCKFIAIVAVAWQPLSKWSNTTPTTFVTFTHWKFLSEIISMYICGECDQIEVWKVVLPTNLKCLSPLGNRGGKCIRNIFSKLQIQIEWQRPWNSVFSYFFAFFL